MLHGIEGLCRGKQGSRDISRMTVGPGGMIPRFSSRRCERCPTNKDGELIIRRQPITLSERFVSDRRDIPCLVQSFTASADISEALR